MPARSVPVRWPICAGSCALGMWNWDPSLPPEQDRLRQEAETLNQVCSSWLWPRVDDNLLRVNTFLILRVYSRHDEVKHLLRPAVAIPQGGCVLQRLTVFLLECVVPGWP